MVNDHQSNNGGLNERKPSSHSMHSIHADRVRTSVFAPKSVMNDFQLLKADEDDYELP